MKNVFSGKKKSSVSVPSGAKFVVDVPGSVSEFRSVMNRLSVKKIMYNLFFMGKGLEFDSYRNFESFDDSSMIDWKASLRANELLAKKYIEEKDLNVYFLVDVSNSMLFGSRDKLKSEYVAEVVCALSHLVMEEGDRIGLVMFSDKVVKFLEPVNSKNQFSLFVKFLCEPDLYGGSSDFNVVVEEVLRRTKGVYNVFFVFSDFIKFGKGNSRAFRLLGTAYETVAVMVRDELDENLPKTKYQLSLQDPYSNRQIVLDPKIMSGRFRESVIRQKGVVKDIFKNSRVDSLDLITNKNFTVPLASFLKRRASMRGKL